MKSYDGPSTKNTCYSTAYFIFVFFILRTNLRWILFTAVLLFGCTTLHYILNDERCIKPEFILYVFSHYLHRAQLLLRPHCMYLRIICTVLNCFFGLSICIFVLFALCSAASSASLYVSSYYLHCSQLLLRPLCVCLRIICTVLNCFFGLSDYPTEKRAVIYLDLSVTYLYHSWNLITFILKTTRYFRHCGLCVPRAVNTAAASVHNSATQFLFHLVTIF